LNPGNTVTHVSRKDKNGLWQADEADCQHYRVLLIDDRGLETLNTAQRNDLMETMDDRHGSTQR